MKKVFFGLFFLVSATILFANSYINFGYSPVSITSFGVTDDTSTVLTSFSNGINLQFKKIITDKSGYNFGLLSTLPPYNFETSYTYNYYDTEKESLKTAVLKNNINSPANFFISPFFGYTFIGDCTNVIFENNINLVLNFLVVDKKFGAYMGIGYCFTTNFKLKENIFAKIGLLVNASFPLKPLVISISDNNHKLSNCLFAVAPIINMEFRF